MTVSAGRSAVRTVLAVACLLLVAALFGVVARTSFASVGADRELVQREQYGAAMLHPMTTLLAALAGAQSAAVQGQRVDRDGVRAALAGVAEQDAAHGATLGTHRRLADLTARVETAFAQEQAGRPAYTTYSDLIALTIDLTHRIGDTSHLVHDSELDAYYLVDSAVVRLPDAMVSAGQVSDLVALAGAQTLSGPDAQRAAVARFGISADAQQVGAGLAMSVDNTSRAQLSTNITQRLDAFLAAVDQFAPPTMLHDASTDADMKRVVDGAARVLAAAASLAHLLLNELQALLTSRSDELAQRTTMLTIVSVAAGVVGLVLAVLIFMGTGVGRRASSAAGPQDRQPVTVRPRPDHAALAELVGAARTGRDAR